MNKPRERRYKVVELSDVGLMAILQGSKFEVINHLPRRTNFKGVYWRPEKLSFSILVENSCFENVPEGQIVPAFENLTVRQDFSEEKKIVSKAIKHFRKQKLSYRKIGEILGLSHPQTVKNYENQATTFSFDNIKEVL